MKTIVMTAAAIALATPVFAGNFNGGSPTAFALKHFAESHESGDGPRLKRFLNKTGDVSFTTQGGSKSAAAAAILDNDERGFDGDDE